MTIIKEYLADCEMLWMELEWCQPHRFNEQIMIAYNRATDETEPYLSIIIYGLNKEQPPVFMWGQIFPNMEEVDIIIEALQEAKRKALEIREESNMEFIEEARCWFCGSEPKVDYYIIPNLYRVKCTHCGTSTPTVVDRERAIRIWNCMTLEEEE